MAAAARSPPTELERIRALVAEHFPVYETRVGPQSLLLAVHVDRGTLEPTFDRLRQSLRAQGYIPLLRREVGEDFIEVVRRPTLSTRGLWVNAALLAATIATSAFAGALLWITYTGTTTLTTGAFVDGALYFALPILAILGLHEFAHYAIARRRRLDASLPFFLPVPPPLPFGTFGAFVSIRDPFPDRKAMFDVSAGGPLAGFAVAVPIAVAGLYLTQHAPIVPAAYCAPTILGLNYGHEVFSPSLLWALLAYFVPSGGAALHPLALAGWVGILVTSINLLPIGSLDGGRVARALLGDRARFVSYGAAFALFGLGIFYTGWFIFGILVLVLGLRNPPPLNDVSPIGAPRLAIGAVVAAVLVAGFVLVPIQLTSGTVGMGTPGVTYPTLPPSAQMAANVSVELSNPDPVPHAYSIALVVAGVVLDEGGHPTTLGPGALMQWNNSTHWTYRLPNGTTVDVPSGAIPDLPAPYSVELTGSGAGAITVAFWSTTGSVVEVELTLSANVNCPASGSGSTSESIVVRPP